MDRPFGLYNTAFAPKVEIVRMLIFEHASELFITCFPTQKVSCDNLERTVDQFYFLYLSLCIECMQEHILESLNAYNVLHQIVAKSGTNT